MDNSIRAPLSPDILTLPNQGTASGNHHLTNAELESLILDYRQSYEQKVAPTVRIYLQRMNELNEQMIGNNQAIEQARLQQQLGMEKEQRGMEKEQLGREMQQRGMEKEQRGTEKVKRAQEKIDEADRVLEEIAKEKQRILTKTFYGIFFPGKKDTLSTEQLDALFVKYLADRSLTVEKDSSNKSFSKINSMSGVIHFLRDHPDVVTCDFRPFKAEISDISTLADYLKDSAIKAVAFKVFILDSDKALLAEAAAARNGTLKVQYFA
jgi:hypothetical protein